MKNMQKKWFSENNKKWLNKKFEVYLDPSYYEKILPKYNFNGKSDEEILEGWLKDKIKEQGHKFKLGLELGCGSGRGTNILAKYCEKIVAVDLNKKMLELAKKRFASNNKIIFYNEEMLEFVDKNKQLMNDVDLVVSFWAINYSLNAEFAFRDPQKKIFQSKNPELALSRGIKKLESLFDNISDDSKFIFFHYDPESEEQKIAHYCWEKIVQFPFGEKSPSLLTLRKFFENRKDINSCICKINGLVDLGKTDRALETFMNFHLHTSFNNHQLEKEIIEMIEKHLKKYDQKNIKMCAGTIILKGEKIKCQKN